MGGYCPRYHSNQLLTLPALPALNHPCGSSASVAQSNDDVYLDNSSHQCVASPASNTTEQPVEDYYGTSASASARYASPRHTSHGAVHQTPSPARFPGEMRIHSSLTTIATMALLHHPVGPYLAVNLGYMGSACRIMGRSQGYSFQTRETSPRFTIRGARNTPFCGYYRPKSRTGYSARQEG